MTGSLDVSTPGTTITAKTIQAAPSSNLNLNGIVLLNGINVEQSLSSSADTTYVNTQLDNKVDVSTFASNVITVNNALNTKAPKDSATFSGTTTMTGSLDVSTPGTTITAKTIQAAPSSNLNLNGIVLLNGANMEQSLNSKANQSTTYTKTEVDTKFTDIINSAPDALNTLSELANALANDSNYASTIANQLATKASISYVNSQIATSADNISGKEPAFDVLMPLKKTVDNLGYNVLFIDPTEDLTLNSLILSSGLTAIGDVTCDNILIRQTGSTQSDADNIII